MSARSPLSTGVLLAIAAAVAFGVTTPIVAWAGHWIGPFSTAALLYAGAALAAVLLRLVRRTEAPLRRRDISRVIAVAVIGGAIAPVLLAWGLQRSGPTIGALLLNLEAVFTVLLARAFFREPMGKRVVLAMLAMLAGGAALVIDVWHAATWSITGLLAVAAATAAWATDNTLTRALSEREPLDVIASKGAIGALLTGGAAVVAAEPMPPAFVAASLLVCGATGYGVSLRLYLLAQRRIGAGRTGSVFALAPFIGAAIAFALGDRSAGAWSLVAVCLFGAGVYLHATEHHGHHHVHDSIDHDHVHRHPGDEHHQHEHLPPFVGEHAHAHHHDRLEHAHAHAPDLHHRHTH